MSASDTIVAQATPQGWSARALIRVSGHQTDAILATHCPSAPTDRGAHAARLALPAGELPIAVLRYGAASYTGEPSAEILLPGNPHLVERVIAVLCAHEGVRLAGPGEFSARAFMNGRLTLDQAEGVAGVIAARTDEQLAAALETMAGAAGDALRVAAEELATLLALVEAGVDFTDQEDVVPIAPDQLDARLRALAAAMPPGVDTTPIETGRPLVALVGPPSAGKSTLFNALLGRERAVTDAEPGTTRDVLIEPMDLASPVGGTIPIELADAPGLDDAHASPLRSAAERAIRAADLVLHCDPLAAFAPFQTDAPVIRVRTKADQPSDPGVEGLGVCALDGFGLETLRRAVAESIAGARSAGRLAAMPRRHNALRATRRRLNDAIALVDARAESLDQPELIAIELRAALDALGELTGAVSRDDVIGRVFAAFCVGK